MTNHACVGRDQSDEMLLAQYARICEVRHRARRVDKMTRVLYDHVGLVAVPGKLGRDPWKQIIDDADRPCGTSNYSVAGPMRNFIARNAEDLGRSLRFVAGTKWASLYSVINRGIIERLSI